MVGLVYIAAFIPDEGETISVLAEQAAARGDTAPINHGYVRRAELEAEAKKHPVKGIAQVRNAAEAQKALASGYPIAVCSNQGFAMGRDAEGFCRAQGSWAHCMAVVGYQTSGARKGFFILNSWGGSAHTGPIGKGSPSPAGFWAEWSVVDRMLQANDSWAFSDVKGFPARRIDWFAQPAPAGRSSRQRSRRPWRQRAWTCARSRP
mgnify:CR=1 FL=1